jgi:hypothetical protein
MAAYADASEHGIVAEKVLTRVWISLSSTEAAQYSDDEQWG